jgi:hypothetical protein
VKQLRAKREQSKRPHAAQLLFPSNIVSSAGGVVSPLAAAAARGGARVARVRARRSLAVAPAQPTRAGDACA